MIISTIDEERMLSKVLFFKWDDSNGSSSTEHDRGAGSAVKPVDVVETKVEVKSLVSGLGNTKGKRAAEAAIEGEQTLADDTSRIYGVLYLMIDSAL